MAHLPLLRPLLLHFVNLAAEQGDSLLDPPPVAFQLGFAGAAPADAALLPLKLRVQRRQPGQQIIELGQLHLQFAFPRPRPLGEDVQDKLRSVQDAPLQRVGQVPLLGRRQFIIENN